MHKRRCDAKHNIENTLISIENTHISVKSTKILNAVLINESQRTKKCYSFRKMIWLKKKNQKNDLDLTKYESQRTKKCYSFNLVADKEISLMLFCYRDENVFR